MYTDHVFNVRLKTTKYSGVAEQQFLVLAQLLTRVLYSPRTPTARMRAPDLKAKHRTKSDFLLPN
jgi:hypothetical protein